MPWYSEPPSCQRCGGALLSEDETCRCSGRSASRWQEEDTELVRRMTWAEAIAELRKRYADP